MAGQSSYNPHQIEKKWQNWWEEQQLYHAPDQSDKPKYYSLVMFPYPSGDLHIGHWYSYTGPDIFARYMRMHGHNVMHPFGFDAFGLPAENAAIKRGLHPEDWTRQNIKDMIKQIKTTGASFDWQRQVDTSDPDYYKWTQWIFLQLYKKGLAYRGIARVNWCETDQTVLANEQVEDGLCWRCGNPVVQKELAQWFFRITDYADELLNDLESLDWPATTKTMQINWIGRSEGVEINFSLYTEIKEKVADRTVQVTRGITVFTTRPDTLYGVTYLVIAPEHKIVSEITSPDKKAEVEQYVQNTAKQSELDRQTHVDQKTGVFTGAYAIHPLTGDKLPIWIADYVLPSYGTGAVMGVPAHDQRDWEFAHVHNLPIKEVIAGGDITQQAYTDNGDLIQSDTFTGMPSLKAKQAIAQYIERQQIGERKVQYRLRDWLVSRQRYWGPPIPMIECDQCGLVPVPDQDLPVVLPHDVDFTPHGVPPLATNEQFMAVTCPQCHKPARRVAETIDTFVDSSWYYLRYADPHNANQPFSQKLIDTWLPVDAYMGGIEHAILHLLYSRFITKALRDCGLLKFGEPFTRLRHQGMILGPDHQKMSKSKGNVVNPDELVADFGADAVRMQLVFMGPYSQGGPWQLTGIHGVSRYLQRVWGFQQSHHPDWSAHSDPSLQTELARATDKISEDIVDFKFNTAIAHLMSTLNLISKTARISRQDWEAYLKLLAPFAPHITEELWHQLGHNDSIHQQPWPEAGNHIEQPKTVNLPIQINGKVRASLSVSLAEDEQKVIESAKSLETVKKYLDGKNISRTVYVPGRILNLIIT